MPDTYVKLPNGQYVQIPEGASPEQLQQMKSRLVQMQASPESQAPNAVAQSRTQMAARVHPVSPVAPGKEQAPITSPGQEAQINAALPKVDQRIHDIRSAVLSAGGASLGSEFGAMAQGLPKFVQMMAGASGAGAGAGAGAFAGGTSPKEALGIAAGTTATNAIASPLLKWLSSSKSVGAKALQAASQKAGNAPVELSPQTNEIVDKIVQQGKLGGKIPKVITDFLDRVGPSTRQAAEASPGPLTYDEARILQSNASQLSVNEANDLKGQLKSLIPQFARSFGRDVQTAADVAGAGPEHAIGMQEYAAASSRNRALTKIGKAAVGSGAAAIGGKILYDLGKNMASKR